METFYIQIPSDKRAFFLNLMHELNFVKISESNEELTKSDEEYIMAIIESEQDIELDNVISHQMLKEEVKSWLK